jgi:predicted Zn-dependent protease
MARAGYDPRESIAFWERMSQLESGGRVPEFASTHPSNSTRIRDLQAEMPRALAEYQAAGH